MDRNGVILDGLDRCVLSLSARRAWIEILSLLRSVIFIAVALRKESVDRNRLAKCAP